MGTRPVDDVREKMGMARNAEPLADIGRVASVPKIAIGKDAFRRIDSAPAGELEIKPILAVQGVGGFHQPLGLMLLQPGKLDRLLAGVEAGAGCRIVGSVIGSGNEGCGHLGRTRVEPDQGVANRFAVCIDQPAAITLAGHGKTHRTACQIGYDRRQITKRLLRVVPGPQHILLDAAATETGVGIRARRHPDLHTIQRKRHGFQDGSARIDADDEIARHAARTP